MMKIFTTQLTGHFNRIVDQETLDIEDSSRLLAQALVGEGNLYLYGHKELHGIVLEAISSNEPLLRAKPLLEHDGQITEVSSADRVLLFTHFSTDEEAIQIAKSLAKKGIQTVGVSAIAKDAPKGLESITDFHIDSKLRQPLIPGDDGNRYGFPALMTSLYVYYAIHFTIQEILSEYDEEL
ncbi:DUF2529 family protein [Virgibacillus sp. 6R]|uniref:DUF2529 family protein n=1 Tax=Metabacillus sp. 22489 TaxID=3453928 RepID=UPI0011A8DF2B